MKFTIGAQSHVECHLIHLNNCNVDGIGTLRILEALEFVARRRQECIKLQVLNCMD